MEGPCGICGRSWEWHVENTGGCFGEEICNHPFWDDEGEIVFDDAGFEEMLKPEHFTPRRDVQSQWVSSETGNVHYRIPFTWEPVAGPTWVGYLDVEEDDAYNLDIEGALQTWIEENRDTLATLYEARREYPGRGAM